jgi:hypothetical protein
MLHDSWLRTMSVPNPQAFYQAVDLLERNNIPIESFLRRLFVEPSTSSRAITLYFIQNISTTLESLRLNPRTAPDVDQWIKKTFSLKLQHQIRDISRGDAGYHFVAKSATVEHLKQCQISQLAEGMIRGAPDVWDLVGALLQADPDIIRRRERARRECVKSSDQGSQQQHQNISGELDNDNNENGQDGPVLDFADEDRKHLEDQLEKESKSLIKIVSYDRIPTEILTFYLSRNKLHVLV